MRVVAIFVVVIVFDVKQRVMWPCGDGVVVLWADRRRRRERGAEGGGGLLQSSGPRIREQSQHDDSIQHIARPTHTTSPSSPHWEDADIFKKHILSVLWNWSDSLILFFCGRSFAERRCVRFQHQEVSFVGISLCYCLMKERKTLLSGASTLHPYIWNNVY